MDPVTAIGLLFTLAKIAQIGVDVYTKLRSNRGTAQGIAANTQGVVQQVPTVSGVPLPTGVTSSPQMAAQQRVAVQGDFAFESSLQWLQGDELVLLLVLEGDYDVSGEFCLLGFDLDGYALGLLPGEYYFYAFVLDPEASDLFEAEILAVGFPDLGEALDPNPVGFRDIQYAEMDFLFFDRLNFPDAPCYLGQL
jgi:hypothetical protein